MGIRMLEHFKTCCYSTASFSSFFFSMFFRISSSLTPTLPFHSITYFSDFFMLIHLCFLSYTHFGIFTWLYVKKFQPFPPSLPPACFHILPFRYHTSVAVFAHFFFHPPPQLPSFFPLFS